MFWFALSTVLVTVLLNLQEMKEEVEEPHENDPEVQKTEKVKKSFLPVLYILLAMQRTEYRLAEEQYQ